MAAAVYWA